MIQYFLYKIGMWIAFILPVKLSYPLASFVAVLQYRFSRKDRKSVINNLKVILASEDDKAMEPMAKEVFINFSKYLVDFFRFSLVDKNNIEKFVKIEGRENIEEAFKNGKGIIAVTAHIGNWELAGIVTAIIGYPVTAVALSHKHKHVNELFVRQRESKGVNVVPLGVALRKCYAALKKNEVIGLVGDRDFTQGGISMEFLGKTVKIPKGPAMFSVKTGAPIVMTFAIRQPDDSYKLIYKKPIYYKDTGNPEEDVKTITKKFITEIEAQIRLYPQQWFMFREFWADDANKVDIL